MTMDCIRASPSENVLCTSRTHLSVRGRTYGRSSSQLARCERLATPRMTPNTPAAAGLCAVEQKRVLAHGIRLKSCTVNTQPDPRQNHVLNALPPLERERLLPF